MITPHLEDKIHSGIASSRTFVVGDSGDCVLPVPDGKYIVIHNFIYHPFFNEAEKLNGQQAISILQQANKQVQFRSEKTSNHFIFRDSGAFVLIPIIVDTYLVHFSNVAISFLQIPILKPGQIIFGGVKTTNDVIAAPGGYGTLKAVLAVNLDPLGMKYQPAGIDNDQQSMGNGYRREYKVDHNINTQLFDPSGAKQDEFIDRSLPLMTVQYVLINKMETDKIQASS